MWSATMIFNRSNNRQRKASCRSKWKHYPSKIQRVAVIHVLQFKSIHGKHGRRIITTIVCFVRFREPRRTQPDLITLGLAPIKPINEVFFPHPFLSNQQRQYEVNTDKPRAQRTVFRWVNLGVDVLLSVVGGRIAHVHVVGLAGYVFFVRKASYLRRRWEDVLVEEYNVFYEIVDEILVLDLVLFLGHRHQRRPKTDGQIVNVHHVFIAKLRQTETTTRVLVVKTHNITTHRATHLFVTICRIFINSRRTVIIHISLTIKWHDYFLEPSLL